MLELMYRTQQMTITLVVTSVLFGCRFSSQESELQHVYGQTKVNRQEPLEQCTDGAEHPLVVSYLRRIANFIMDKNGETFVGQYSKEKFCFALKNTQEVNASAKPHNGRVEFMKGIFDNLHSDAEVAAVLGHELAHITLNHALNSPPEVRNSAEWLNLQSAFRKSVIPVLEAARSLFRNMRDAESSPIMAEIRKRISTDQIRQFEDRFGSGDYRYAISLFVAYQNLFTSVKGMALEMNGASEIANFITEIDKQVPILESAWQRNTVLIEEIDSTEYRLTGSYERSINWREQDADEAGYELYLLAGFDRYAYTEFQKNLSFGGNSPNYSDCERMLENGKVPDRGFESHPQACWRKFDIEILESANHQADYAPLYSNANTKTIFPGGLQEVKSYLKAQ